MVLFAFDLLNSVDQDKVKDLIANSIKHVAPTEQYTRAMSGVPIRISVQNSTEPADVGITESALDRPINEWQFSLESNEQKTLTYSLLLPDAVGEYQLGTELKYSNQGNYRLYGNYSLTITVFSNSADLLVDAIAELQGLAVSKSDAAHTNNAIGYMNQLRDYSGITKPDAQANIDSILNALSELEKVSVDVSVIRLKLDELLKIWQAKWSLSASSSPLEKGVNGVVKDAWIERIRFAYETDARKMEKQVTDSSCASFPRTVIGNPLSCKKPVLLASAGSTSGLLYAPSADVIYYYHTDHLGTPILLTDGTGNKVWEGEFLPFGEAYSITGSITNNLRFPGQYYDEETGLHQNWHRDYRPEMGRYVERDPIGFEGGKMNLFEYVGGNPVNWIDPLGLLRWHGNWGGPGWTAGQNKPESQLISKDLEVPAVDERDACYKGHDICIWKDPCNIKNCDHILARCLRNISPFKSCFWGTDQGYLVDVLSEANAFNTFIPDIIHR